MVMMSHQEQSKEGQSGSENIQCPFCGQDFQNKARLKDHCVQVHVPEFSVSSAAKEEIIELEEETNIKYPKETIYNVKEEENEASKFEWNDSVTVGLSETGKTVKVHKKKLSLSQNGAMKCPKCSTEFQNKKELKNHFINQHPVQDINESETQGHRGTEQNGFELENNHFEKYFKSANHGFNEIEPENIMVDSKVSQLMWKDSVKLSRTETGTLVKVHKKKMHISGNGKMGCPRCGKEFPSKEELRGHFIQEHTTQGIDEPGKESKDVDEKGEQRENLYKNRKTSNLRKTVKKEQRKMNKPEELTCKYCCVYFAEKNEFKKHVKRYSDKDKNYICSESECGQKYIWGNGKGSNALQIHMMKHRGEQKSISCGTCGNMFCTKISLNIHRKDHTSRGSFNCEDCGKLFDLERNLKTHIKIHKNEANLPCSQCPKRCSASDRLKQHMELHNQRRKFGCTICNARFKDAFVAKRHLVTHEVKKQH